MTKEEAQTLYKVLRSVCVIKSSSILHVGGHVISGNTRDAGKPKERNRRRKTVASKMSSNSDIPHPDGSST